VAARFLATVQTGPEAHSPFCTIDTGFFPVVKRLGRGVDHPTTPSAEVKERVQLYPYFPRGLHGVLYGTPLPIIGLYNAQNRNRWPVFVNAVMNRQVPYNARNFLTS
jgi:hypothetical protein